MPLFGKKKEKTPKRRLEAGSSHLNKSNLSLGETADYTDSTNALVKLKLGGHELVFQDGEWCAGKRNYKCNFLQVQSAHVNFRLITN